MATFEVTDKDFEAITFNFENYFKYSFGITVSEIDPVDVVISFDPEQGNYLKTLPIHPTQEIIKDNSKEFLTSLIFV